MCLICRNMSKIKITLWISFRNLIHMAHQKGVGISRFSDSLRFGRCGDRIQAEAIFSVPVLKVSGANTASYRMGTNFPSRSKQLHRGANHPPASSAKNKERVALYLYSPSGPLWLFLGRNLRHRRRSQYKE